MFKFLKEKLKGAISKISRSVGEEKPAEEPIKEEPIRPVIGPAKKEQAIQKELREEELGQDEDSSGDRGLDEELEDLEKLSSAAKAKKEETSSYQPLPDEFEEELFGEDKPEEEAKAESPAESNPEVVEIPPEEEYAEKPELAEKDQGAEQENEEFPEEDEPETERIPEKAIEEKKERGFLGLFRRKSAPEGTLPPKGKEEAKVHEQPGEGKKGLLGKFAEKITTTKISREKFESFFSELEIILMENNVAVEVIDKIKNDLSGNLVERPIKRTRVEEVIRESLRKSIEELFNVDKISLIKSIKGKGEKPFVIAFFGINGSGKTTSIAKVASMLKQNKISVVLAAADTFRAASIEQLQQHADKLGVKMIKHDYGSDPAAVAFDAIKHAKAKGADAVLIDTAGRLHSQQNLMEEMKKIMRVAKPDLKIFVGESITGNDCVEQAKSFDDAVGIDGLILAKADVDEKGGAAISVSYITKKPIMYLGVGQEYGDLKEFEPKLIVDGLGL